MSQLSLYDIYVPTHPALTPESRESKVCSISSILDRRMSGLNQNAPEPRSTWVIVPGVSWSKGRFTVGGTIISIGGKIGVSRAGQYYWNIFWWDFFFWNYRGYFNWTGLNTDWTVDIRTNYMVWLQHSQSRCCTPSKHCSGWFLAGAKSTMKI